MGQVREKSKGSRREEAGKVDRVQWVMSLGTANLDRREAGYPGYLGWREELKTHPEMWPWGSGSWFGEVPATAGSKSQTCWDLNNSVKPQERLETTRPRASAKIRC